MFLKQWFTILIGLVVVSGCANPVKELYVIKISTLAPCNGQYCWSPDGGYVAFTHNQDLWIMNLDGNIKKKIYSGFPMCPHWSPDAQEIVFESEGDIWIHRIAIGKSLPLTSNGKSRNPSWHPDSNKILFLNSGDIWIMDRDGANQKELKKVGRDTYPLFSPDGERICYYINPNSMNVIDADGSNHQQFICYTIIPNWVWSKDSEEILYCANRGDQKRILSSVGRLIIDKDKEQIFPIVVPSEVPKVAFVPAVFLVGIPEHISTFSYSPDSDSKIVAISLQRNSEVNVYATDLNQPKHTIQLTQGGGDRPIWSPDGKKILFLNQGQIGIVWLK